MTQNTPPISSWFVKPDYLLKSEKNGELIRLKLDEFPNNTQKHLADLHVLFQSNNLDDWLFSIADFLNKYDSQNIEFSKLFHQWSLEEQKLAVRYFSEQQVVDCINAIFFYKLYPDKLFNKLIHPEKLVSVRMRLGVLHQFIEMLYLQLVNFARPHGLEPDVDHLFHGNNLPQGIMIEVNEHVRDLIQIVVTRLKVKFTAENQAEVTHERLHDLGRSYKFWFNPNRLIDAVMILQQCLVKTKTSEENNLLVFHQEMVVLFGKLTTTECLDLYGYFSNKDSRYLFHTLLAITEDKILDWLPTLKLEEKKAIISVFQALQCVMEALRVELKNRHMSTEPYLANLSKKYTRAGKRNREAVHRIIVIYAGVTVITNASVEKLFNFMEGDEH